MARAAAAVRDLVQQYSPAKRRSVTERYIAGMLHGYLGAQFKTRLRNEMAVATRKAGGGRGRPEQIDFAIGRKRRDGEWTADSIIEFAVRRPGHRTGADPSCNTTEVSKLCRADAKHRILLLLDLTDEDYGGDLKDKYIEYKRRKGRPIKGTSIKVIYVGAAGMTKFRMPAQRLAPRKRSSSSRR
jgi:hypothetical protein